jgi:hypothetical protein
VKQTRLKLVIGMTLLALVEGLIKAFLSGFPLIEVFSIQGMLVGTYVGAKTVSGIKESENENNKPD